MMAVATISKDFAISASHQLAGLTDGHPCARLHGHNYLVRVELTGLVDERVGFVLDYGMLRPFGAYLDRELDHQHLNHQMSGNPTAERLGLYLLRALRTVLEDGVPALELMRLRQLRVGVSETPKTWAFVQEAW